MNTTNINPKIEVQENINPDGDIFYYKKGSYTLHRKDGPAYISKTGYTCWYLHGYRHRMDGPALVSTNYVEYYLHGRYFKDKDEWLNEVRIEKLKDI